MDGVTNSKSSDGKKIKMTILSSIFRESVDEIITTVEPLYVVLYKVANVLS